MVENCSPTYLEESLPESVKDPGAHICDFSVVAELDEKYTDATIKIKVKVVNPFENEIEFWTIEAMLYHPDQSTVFHELLTLSASVKGEGSCEIQASCEVENPLKWSAEYPNLYTLVLSLKDGDGCVIESQSCKIGFRKFEFREGVMKLSGQPIALKGVHRQEFPWGNEKARGIEEKLIEIKCMKQYNINAVYIAQDPGDILWYDLCDEYGICVIEETEIENRGTWGGRHIHHPSFPDVYVPVAREEFYGDGLFLTDGTIHPRLYEVKKRYQNVKFEAEDLKRGRVKITNQYLFTNLEEMETLWEVLRNGEVVSRGGMMVPVAPGETEIITLPYTLPEQRSQYEEYFLNLSLRLKEDSPWAAKGHEVASEQFALSIPQRTIRAEYPRYPRITLTEKEESLKVEGQKFTFELNKNNGDILSYCYKETELFREPPVPNFWRACIDKDKADKVQERCATWREAGRNRILQALYMDKAEDRIKIQEEFLLPTAAPSLCKVSYTVYGNGGIEVTQELLPGEHLPEIPEVGMMLVMDSSFQNMAWYGRGPYENYWDRAAGVKVGLYKGTVKEQLVPYPRPQECGNKTGVRWAVLTNSQGLGMTVTGKPWIEVNALEYTPVELEENDQIHKLPSSDKVVLRVNYRQMGMGSGDRWGAKTLPEFTLYANRSYAYSFSLCGIEWKK